MNKQAAEPLNRPHCRWVGATEKQRPVLRTLRWLSWSPARRAASLTLASPVKNMSVEAQLLKYGTKIISSPTIVLNGENQETFRELLGIPDDQSAVAVLLVGMEDTSLEADAVTAATIRNAAEEIVTKVTP